MRSKFTFLTLNSDLLEQARFDPLPFPVRKKHIKIVKKKHNVSIEGLLTEMEAFTDQHPEHAEKYCHNIGQLAFICDSRYVEKGDLQSALLSLAVGLRVFPENNHLRTHQALLLQSLGHHALAAAEYSWILQSEPFAYDPVIRALAAKAFVAADDQPSARQIIGAIPETALDHPDLQPLRKFMKL